MQSRIEIHHYTQSFIAKAGNTEISGRVISLGDNRAGNGFMSIADYRLYQSMAFTR